jgi:hypothetical protein
VVDRKFSASVGAGVTQNVDIDVRRIGTIVVAYKLAGTVTAADLTFGAPLPFDATGTPLAVGLPAKATVAAAAAGADVVALATYDCVGIERLRLTPKNNSAGALVLTVDVFGANEGRM